MMLNNQSSQSPQSTLVLTDSFESRRAAVVDDVRDVRGASLIIVSYTRSLQQIHQLFKQQGYPAHLTYIRASPESATDSQFAATLSYPVETHHVQPDDLTGLSIAITNALDADRPQTRFCFDSLTTLLQYADMKTVYRFVHTTVGQLASHSATSRFHLATTVYDSEVVNALQGLFEQVQTTDSETVQDSESSSGQRRNVITLN